MRRLVLSIVMASGLVMIYAGSASAEPAPAAGTAKAVAGKKVCKVEDSRLTALSGMVATRKGFVVINDGVPLESGKRVFFLDDQCNVDKSVSYGGGGPRDTEDMVLSADGKTLWIADTGDNQRDRETVGLWSMPVDGSKQPKIHRLTYPDGAHDAEGLLLDGDDTPIIVTKEVGKPAGLYSPATALKTNNSTGVALKRVGEVTVPISTTPSGFPLGRGSIDGAAIAPGGTKVALRTYSDALEWDVKGGDVLAALKTKPRVTPLPNEPFGEAISYSADGKSFLTVSDMDNLNSDAANHILRYTPTVVVSTKVATAAGAVKAAKGQSWIDQLSLDDITYLVGGVGVLGAILVGMGIVGIVRARKRPLPPEPAGRQGPPKGPRPGDRNAETALIDAVRDDPPVRGRPAADLQGAGHGQRPGGVYGAGGPPRGAGGPPRGSGGYGAGAAPSAPPMGGGVYGAPPAGRPGPGVYGAPPPPPPARPAGPSARPSGFFPDGGRQGSAGANGVGGRNDQSGRNGSHGSAGVNGAAPHGPAPHGPGPRAPGSYGSGANGSSGDRIPGHDGYFDNPGYGRTPQGR
jgi:hypothetical protein